MLRSEIHSRAVDAWEKRNAAGLSAEKHAQLLGKAIQALEHRTLKTLSSVTVMVVLDRALHLSKEKFPLLSEVRLVESRLDFTTLFGGGDRKSEEAVESLRYLLTQVMDLVGSITADILTGPLHKELAKVTWERTHAEAERSHPKKPIKKDPGEV